MAGRTSGAPSPNIPIFYKQNTPSGGRDKPEWTDIESVSGHSRRRLEKAPEWTDIESASLRQLQLPELHVAANRLTTNN